MGLKLHTFWTLAVDEGEVARFQRKVPGAGVNGTVDM
jgi:hypothetical protein